MASNRQWPKLAAALGSGSSDFRWTPVTNRQTDIRNDNDYNDNTATELYYYYKTTREESVPVRCRSSKMGLFEGCQITLELDSVPFKKKLELKNKVIENGGVISFIVTQKVAITQFAM